jgi:dienelactone hydrolase
MIPNRRVKGLVYTIGCFITFSACEIAAPSEDGIEGAGDSGTDGYDSTDVDTSDAPISTGTEWKKEIVSTADTPDLEDAEVSLYIPKGVSEARGVLVFSYIGVGTWEYEHEVWRASAASHGYAMLHIKLTDIHGRVAPWEFPEQSALFIYRTLDTMAQISNHTELERAPLFFFGHSAGGFWFTRVVPHLTDRAAGFIAFHGTMSSDELFSPSALSVPGLFLVAEYDPIWIRTDTSEIADTGFEKGALWSLVIEPDAGHWDVDPGRRLMVEFVETIFDLRVAPTSAPDGAKKLLSDIPEEDIRFGQLAHYSIYDGDEEFEDSGREVITAASISSDYMETAMSNSRSRLISQTFAESWLAYELSGI